MKIGREELKSLIKECVIEVLRDGFNASQQEIKESSQRSAKTNRDPSDDFIHASHRPTNSKMVSENISKLTKDPVLASVLIDTANTIQSNSANSNKTTQAQIAGSKDAGVSLNSTMFERWSNAAFSTSTQKDK